MMQLVKKISKSIKPAVKEPWDEWFNKPQLIGYNRTVYGKLVDSNHFGKTAYHVKGNNGGKSNGKST